VLDKIYNISQIYIKNYQQEYKRYFLKEIGFKHRLTILIGQRGVGKTTTLIQFILDSYNYDIFTQKALFIQADHFLIQEESLYEIASEFVLNGGELLCIDEIHKYKNWSQELKSIYDTFNKLKIIATGSSALEIHKGSHDLSRRAIVYKMYGMSFREYLALYHKIELEQLSLDNILSNHQQLAHSITTAIEKTNNKVIPLFKQYLKTGYYPYFYELKDESLFYITLEQNIHATVENDLLFVYPSLSGNSIKKMLLLLSFIRNNAPFVPDMKKLKNIIGVGDERTLKNYLKYLEDASLIKLLQKSSSGISAIEKIEKIYLNNPNLLYIDDANIGTIRETFFLSMLDTNYKITAPKKGDFLVDDKYLFEIGGKSKSFKQIKDIEDSFVVADDIEVGFEGKIPLWLFGFMY